jgi:uncharacterized membrane protein YagU involved in acid resistance
MLLVSFVRTYIWRKVDFIQLSSLLYTSVSFVLAFLYCYNDSKEFIAVAMISCLLMGIINSIELLVVRKKILSIP